jgi:hypothetical protein
LKYRFRKILVAIAVLLIFFIFGREAMGVLPKLQTLSFSKFWPMCLIYLSAMIVFNVGLAEGFRALLKKNGLELGRVAAYFTFFVPNLGKYLPGKIVFLVGRIELVKKIGGTRRIAISSFLSENFYALVGACLIGIFVFFNTFDLPEKYLLAYVGIALAIWTILVSWWPFVIKKFSKSTISSDLVAEKLFKSFSFGMYYVILWALYGAAGCILSASLFQIEPSDYLIVSSSFVASWLVGYLSFFTPGGLGVREGALVLFLGSAIGSGEAALLSILSRFLWTLAELGCALFFVAKSQDAMIPNR